MLSFAKMALLSSSLFFLFLLLLPVSLSAQTYNNISLGTTFTPLGSTAYWPSPSGDFAFGFLPLSTNPTLFLLAVFFNKLPAKTVVWTANGGNPVTNQSKAELAADGRLSLQDPPGNEVWSAPVNTVSYASMLDTGNFVLWSAGIGMIWQTFDHPTDTILPGQVLNQNATLFSKLMDDDYSQGRFVLTLQNDGNLVLNLVAYPTDFKYDAYWSTLTPASGNNVLVFNASTGSIYLSYPNGGPNGSMVTVFGDVSGDNYLRATLDPDGLFRQYSYPKSSKLIDGTWTAMNTVASDICNHNFETGSGACGFNSYCVPNPGGRSMCICPDHYSFIDPARQYKGCKPDFALQTCEPGGEATFNFTAVKNLDWPLSDAEHFSPMNQTECTDNCLQDCFCEVAIHINSDCWKKKFPLSNGRIGSDVDRVAFIKYSTVNNSSPIGPSVRKFMF